MTNVHRIYTSRQRTGVLGAAVIALLVGTIYVGTHAPVAGEQRRSAPAPTQEASPPAGEAAFIYFPSQYDIKAPAAPEDQPPSF